MPICSTKQLVVAPAESISGQEARLERKIIGVEIEMENLNYPTNRTRYWRFVEEGSLRNGYEAVTVFPTDLKTLPLAIDELYKAFPKRGKENFGFRTSVHVHMNMMYRNADDLKSFLLMYLLYEKNLFQFAGPERINSPYCVPLAWCCLHPFEMWKHLDRYSALNLSALRKHSTLEFRHMEGTHDFRKILQWANILALLMDYSYINGYKHVQRQIENLAISEETLPNLHQTIFKNYRELIGHPDSESIRDSLCYLLCWEN